MLILPRSIGMVIDFFSVLLLFVIIFQVTPNTQNRLNTVLAFFASIVFSFVDLKSNGISDILTPVLYFFIFKFNNSTTFLKKTVSFITAFSIFYFTLNGAALITLRLWPATKLVLPHAFVYFAITDIFLMYLIAYLFLVLEHKVVELISQKFDLYDRFIEQIVLSVALILMTILAAVLIVTRIFKISTSALTTDLIILLVIFIIAFLIFMFYITARIQQLKLEREKDIVKANVEYIEALKETNAQLVRAKHDYKNTLLALSVSLDPKDKDSQKTVQEILKQADINTPNTFLENTALYNIHSKLIPGTIVTKLIEAKAQHIETSVEIPDQLSDSDSDEIEISRILGILFDNAIEAAAQTEQPQLSFAIIDSENYREFIIQNTTNVERANISTLLSEGYTSKRRHSGVGLANVQRIVRNNEHLFLQIDAHDYKFKVTLTYEKVK